MTTDAQNEAILRRRMHGLYLSRTCGDIEALSHELLGLHSWFYRNVPFSALIRGADISGWQSRLTKTWLYRGTLEGLEFEHGHNTWWAPEIIWHEDRYHMYASYVQGMPVNWERPRTIIHYTSVNGWEWKLESKLKLSSERVIDACVAKIPNGKWRMWYKDENHNSYTYCADSDDLYH